MVLITVPEEYRDPASLSSGSGAEASIETLAIEALRAVE
jgi:hypothetical protein